MKVFCVFFCSERQKEDLIPRVRDYFLEKLSTTESKEKVCTGYFHLKTALNYR